jgi:hypothetical protein
MTLTTFTDDTPPLFVPKNPTAEERDLIAKLYTKILNVTSEVSKIPKNGWNDFHKYAFATESDVLEGIRPLLKKQKLAIRPNLVSHYKDGQATFVEMDFYIVDAETGYMEVSRFKGEAQDKGDKGIYKAYTGCQKYFIMKTFNVETGDDPENESPDIQGNNNRNNNNNNNRNNNNGNRNNNNGNRNNNNGNKNQPKVITGQQVSAIKVIIKDIIRLDNSLDESIILNGLRQLEKVGNFEKVETMTEYQGRVAIEYLKKSKNTKQQALQQQNLQQHGGNTQ